MTQQAEKVAVVKRLLQSAFDAETFAIVKNSEFEALASAGFLTEYALSCATMESLMLVQPALRPAIIGMILRRFGAAQAPTAHTPVAQAPAAQVPEAQAPAAEPPAVELPFYYRRFLELLSLGQITRPNPAVLDVITRHCAARLLVLPDCGAAVDLYRKAQLFPGPSTKGHLLTQHGLRVSGPLFPNPGEGSANLLVGATNEGTPVVVKLLAGGVSADGAQQPGGVEAEACRALIESKPAEVPLVPACIIILKLGDEHKSTVGRAPGLYAALCMPRYVSTLTLMVQLPAAAVLAGGRRMAAALEWIHDKEYTHMDVKADNIFVDAEGRWWLGDFGSAVRKGSPVTSTTTCFAPGVLLDLPAEPQYDWHMLAVALVCEMNRNSWRELLVEGGCSPAKNLIAAVKELHGREGCKELARFLNELLERAGYSAALP